MLEGLGILTIIIISICLGTFIVIGLVSVFCLPKWVDKNKTILKIYCPFIFNSVEAGVYKVKRLVKRQED